MITKYIHTLLKLHNHSWFLWKIFRNINIWLFTIRLDLIYTINNGNIYRDVTCDVIIASILSSHLIIVPKSKDNFKSSVKPGKLLVKSLNPSSKSWSFVSLLEEDSLVIRTQKLFKVRDALKMVLIMASSQWWIRWYW